MTNPSPGPRRRDGLANRARLLEAAREVFAASGPDAPLEEIARVAGVSRTTLYRNFETREELAAHVFEADVDRMAELARAVADDPRGIVEFFDAVLAMVQESRGITHVLLGADVTWFTDLSARAARAFEPVIAGGRAAGVVRPEIEVADVMLALHMASAAVSDNALRGLPTALDRVAALLHSALFVAGTPAP